MKWHARMQLIMHPTKDDVIRARHKAPLFHEADIEEKKRFGIEMVIREYFRTQLKGISWRLKFDD